MEEWKKCFSDEAAIYFLWGMCEYLGAHGGLDVFHAFSSSSFETILEHLLCHLALRRGKEMKMYAHHTLAGVLIHTGHSNKS